MTSFWLAVLLLIVIALLIVWQIFTSSKNSVGAENTNIRQETNVTLYHEHLAQLENDLAEGSIEQSSYIQLKAELDKTLIQDVSPKHNTEAKHNAEPKQELVQPNNRHSKTWPLVIAFSIVGLTLYTYLMIGAYPQLSASVEEAKNPHAQLSPEQQLAYRLKELEKTVKDDPNNSEAWFGLGQLYISIGEFDNAIKAFDTVVSQVGEHAEILGSKAQAMYYKNNQQINDGTQLVIDKALALDSLDASTNILLGMDSFSHHDYEKAVTYWQTVLTSGRPGINIQALSGAIDEAKKQLTMNSGTTVSDNSNDLDNKTDSSVEQVESSAAQLSLDVSLAANVEKALMSEMDKTVFIYAVAASGPRMPLAALKIKTSDLPQTIILNDAQAMTPQMKLSSFDKVHVYAVVSMSGNVGIKSGDYKAELLNIANVQKDTLKMVISTKVE